MRRLALAVDPHFVGPRAGGSRRRAEPRTAPLGAKAARGRSTHISGRPLQSLSIELPDAEATARAGAAIASALSGGMVVALRGDLGAGKTTLARGLLRARGVEGSIKSPSYGLVEHYPLPSIYFYHIDFYRFADPIEWETAGLADCFRDDSACLIEWPERVASLLPPVDLELSLAHDAHGGRVLDARALSTRADPCVVALAEAFPSHRVMG